MKAGRGFILYISNENMNDLIKIVKSLEDSGLLINAFTELVKHEIKTRKQISWCIVNTFGRFISTTSDFFNSKMYKWKGS